MAFEERSFQHSRAYLRVDMVSVDTLRGSLTRNAEMGTIELTGTAKMRHICEKLKPQVKEPL